MVAVVGWFASEQQQNQARVARRRRAAFASFLAVAAAVLCTYTYRRSAASDRSRAELLFQHEDIAGKEAERAEAKKLDAIRDPGVGSVRTGEQIEDINHPLRQGGLGVWLGRGESQDENVWNIDYLDKKTNQYYGVGCFRL